MMKIWKWFMDQDRGSQFVISGLSALVMYLLYQLLTKVVC